MNFAFATYFPNGLSVDKLTSELSPYVFTIANNEITILSQVLDPTVITSKFASHVPDQAPFAYYYNFTYAVTEDLMTKIANITSVSDKILYFSAIPNLTDLNTLLSTYVAPAVAMPIYLYKQTGINYLTTEEGDKIVSLQPDEIVVSKNNGQFTSIGDAISYINTLSDTSVIIKLFPGTYMENNPLILPANACLKGQGSAGNTIIVATKPDILLKTTQQNYVSGVSLVGGTIGLYHDGSNVSAFSILRDCLIQMQANAVGISVQNGFGSLVAQNISIFTSATDANPKTGSAVIVNGGSLIATAFIVQALTGYGFQFNGGKGTLDTVSVYYAINGLAINNGSDIRGTLNAFFNCTNGLHILTDTVASSVSLLKIEFIYFENTSIHLYSDAYAKINIYSGNYDRLKTTLNTAVDITGNFTIDTIKTQSCTSYTHGDNTFDYAITPYISTTYIACDSQIFGLNCPNAISAIKYYNGSAFTDVPFMASGNDYWLSLDYVPSLTTINSLSKYWLELTTSDLSVVSVHTNAIRINGPNLCFLGNSRKKRIVYLSGDTFIKPDNADESTQYTITINATTPGITINGQVFATSTASVKSDWTSTSFTYTATGVNMIAITYYIISE